MNFNYTWIMSAITVWSMWLAGDRKKLAWVLGLINQGLWLLFIFQTKAWGLLPMNVALVITYSRNLIITKKELNAK